jgi:hypothetical protein
MKNIIISSLMTSLFVAAYSVVCTIPIKEGRIKLIINKNWGKFFHPTSSDQPAIRITNFNMNAVNALTVSFENDTPIQIQDKNVIDFFNMFRNAYGYYVFAEDADSVWKKYYDTWRVKHMEAAQREIVSCNYIDKMRSSNLLPVKPVQRERNMVNGELNVQVKDLDWVKQQLQTQIDTLKTQNLKLSNEVVSLSAKIERMIDSLGKKERRVE